MGWWRRLLYYVLMRVVPQRAPPSQPSPEEDEGITIRLRGTVRYVVDGQEYEMEVVQKDEESDGRLP